MEVVIRRHEQHCGVTAADIIADAVTSGATTLGLATGSSPLSVYRELIRRHRKDELTFAGVQAFLLDEYVGLPPSHPQSYARVIHAEFINHVDIDSGRVRVPNGIAEDIFAAARAYDALIADAGPIDVQLLGIGANGHIGFNEPGSSLGSRTRVKTLTEQTRRDNARFFTGIDEGPRHVILTAPGSHKAEAVAAAVEGPLTASCPASVLQLHPHVTAVVDEAAAGQLKNDDFYRYALKHKPAQQKD